MQVNRQDCLEIYKDVSVQYTVLLGLDTTVWQTRICVWFNRTFY